MPELAEVEFYRKQWDPGLSRQILAVKLHPTARVFRGADTRALPTLLRGSRLLSSAAHGKRMLFRFSRGLWLGLHLGMTGKLRAAPGRVAPGKHDHLVLVQHRSTLIFTDPRQFGRVVFHQGQTAPDWWTRLPPPVTAPEFTLEAMKRFLLRHQRLPIKAALLLQDGFPGIGNWMADEILWRSRVDPRTLAGSLDGEVLPQLWRQLRWVSRRAVAIIGKDWSDPPPGWLLHERWADGGVCPRHGSKLSRATIGGRTTAWCCRCQIRLAR